MTEHIGQRSRTRGVHEEHYASDESTKGSTQLDLKRAQHQEQIMAAQQQALSIIAHGLPELEEDGSTILDFSAQRHVLKPTKSDNDVSIMSIIGKALQESYGLSYYGEVYKRFSVLLLPTAQTWKGMVRIAKL